MAKGAELFASDRHGVYIPKYFAESINPEQWKYICESDLETLKAGPDHESYWETWDAVLSNAETFDGRILWQDGDLWVIDADAARDDIDSYCQAQLDYEETHRDAGDAYSHMPAESWTSSDDNQLMAYLICQDMQTHGLSVDEIAGLVLDEFKMFAGSIYGAFDLDESAFILAAYPVQEIEIDLSGLGLDGVTFDYVKDSCSAYIKSDLAYMATDAVWFAAITRETLQAAMDDLASAKAA